MLIIFCCGALWEYNKAPHFLPHKSVEKKLNIQSDGMTTRIIQTGKNCSKRVVINSSKKISESCQKVHSVKFQGFLCSILHYKKPVNTKTLVLFLETVISLNISLA